MLHAVLLWALPDSWTQFELLSPDVESRIEEEMRRRMERVVDEAELTRAIALQAENLRSAAEDGVILLATHGQATSDSGIPPPGMSLTLALANRPAAAEPGAGAAGNAPPRSAETTAFVSGAKPIVLEDPDMTAFTREHRSEVPVPGVDRPFNQFQVQAFVLPKEQAGMAVVTVTTFDPGCEDEAREAARSFANTICFVTADDDAEEL